MRTPSPFSFLPIFLLLLVAGGGLPVAEPAIGGRGPLVGGYQPINNVNDQHIKEIGQFAVSEYNKRSRKHLIFQRVVSGKQQVVAGMNYDILIEAGDLALLGRYEAVVYERAWDNYRNLTSFKRVE